MGIVERSAKAIEGVYNPSDSGEENGEVSIEVEGGLQVNVNSECPRVAYCRMMPGDQEIKRAGRMPALPRTGFRQVIVDCPV